LLSIVQRNSRCPSLLGRLWLRQHPCSVVAASTCCWLLASWMQLITYNLRGSIIQIGVWSHCDGRGCHHIPDPAPSSSRQVSSKGHRSAGGSSLVAQLEHMPHSSITAIPKAWFQCADAQQ
jgi:hypothetical protein